MQFRPLTNAAGDFEEVHPTRSRGDGTRKQTIGAS